MGDNYLAANIDIEQLLLGNNFKKKNQTILSGQNISAGMLLGEVKFAAGDVITGTNTGNGTVTLFALSATGIPKIGVYSLVCIEAEADGGIFKLVDPDGITISQDITIAGGTILFAGAGITFTITDGSTDFASGDSFTLEIEAGSGKLKQVVSTSIDGSQFPKYVAIIDTDASLADKETDIVAFGYVNIGKIVFAGSETIETKTGGITYYEQLKSLGILALDSTVMSNIDNA